MAALDYRLSSSEVSGYQCVLNKLFKDTDVIEVAELLKKARIISHDLPLSIRKMLIEFTNKEDNDHLILRGLPLKYDKIPPTPQSILPLRPQFADYNDAIHIITSHLIGDVFTWSTIQHGNIINDVFPIASNASKPMSSGFTNKFGLHNEDAFTDYAGEFLGLMCMRNPDNVPTIISSIRDVKLTDKTKSLLMESVYNVAANIGHELGGYAVPRRPILFGHHDDPYMRINVNYDGSLGLSEVYVNALKELIESLNSNIKNVVLNQGDCLYINNYLAAHGRQAYVPRLDGSDRWYRRLYITTDLHRSRHLRATSESRIINLG